MTTARIDGTQGYDRDVEAFFDRAEAIPFAEKYAAVLHLMPARRPESRYRGRIGQGRG